ncbi:MAG: pyridoxal phosphate-dependent aminotransferase [Fibrobacter sp.]|nr:pyridoxal phosphate-dependent aminotransferase [Fibrobacter sp.]
MRQSKYDFDTIIDRRNTDSIKWNVAENVLPMWVADMDFRTAPEILDALRIRLDYGVFGYADVPDAWYNAYINWWGKRHNLKMEKENLIFSAGVMPSIFSLIKRFAAPGENVVIQSPVYNNFYNCIANSGCNVVENQLIYKNGEYSIDFADLERLFSDSQTNLMILCNPHNPIGEIWNAEDLVKIGELAKKYNVTVISDEIHCDITRPGTRYVPFVAASEICREVSVTCIAPTKTFNLAGLHTSAVYVANASLRRKVRHALYTDKIAAPNSFATVAAIAAFERGEPWLECLREYLWDNRKLVEDFLAKELPEIKAVKGDATYLIWLDISSLQGTGRNVASYLKRKTGLFVIGGDAYGSGGEHFLRMNIACPRSVCLEGLNRLKQGVNTYNPQYIR